jgi:hypothetical protein
MADQRNEGEAAMPLSLAGKGVAAMIAIGSVGAYGLSSPDVRGETVLLERLALKLDHAQMIAPDTAARITDLLTRSRGQPSHHSELDARREQAIARIESALQAKTSPGGGEPGAQSSPVARR